MNGHADVPKPIRSGLVVIDPLLGTPQRVIVMQFNPDALERTLAPAAAGAGQEGDRLQAQPADGPHRATGRWGAGPSTGTWRT